MTGNVPPPFPKEGSYRNTNGLADLALPLPSHRSEGFPTVGASLFHVLEYPIAHRRAGRLRLVGESAEVTLVLTGGVVHTFHSAKRPVEDETVRVMVERGEIPKDIAEKSIQTGREREARPTYVLFEQGLVTAGQVVRAARRAQRDILLGLAAEPQGVFEFEDGFESEEPSDPIETDARAIFLGLFQDLLARHDYPELRPLLAPLEEEHLACPIETLDAITPLHIPPAERQAVLTLFDGTRTLEDIFDHAEIPRHEMARLIYLLYAIGAFGVQALEVATEGQEEIGEEPHEGSAEELVEVSSQVRALSRIAEDLAAADHFAALGLKWTCHPAEVERAAAELTRRFGPSSGSRRDPVAAVVVDEIWARLTEALRALATPAARVAYRHELVGPARTQAAAQYFRQKAEELRGESQRKAQLLTEMADDLTPSASP